jgi:hypothetical protein
MSSSSIAPPVSTERLTPHDLVTYFRCPHEMELAHVRRQTVSGPDDGTALVRAVRTPPDVVPLHHSPLAAPTFGPLTFNEGRIDIFPRDVLVYVDGGEAEEIPILFAPEQIRADPIFRQHGFNLVDDTLGFSGRPDLIVKRSDGGFVPIEYKSTHPFRGARDREIHGRVFDLIQLLAECRLIEATIGTRPPYGILWYGDVPNNGAHEGWIQLPYGEAESAWIRSAVQRVRTDAVRAPVPSESTCSACPPHRDGLCRYAAARYVGGDASRDRFHQRTA